MKHLLKYSEWRGSSEVWRASDVSNLKDGSNAWWLPARLLSITPDAFVLLLKNKFKVSYLSYSKDKNVLSFGWDNYIDCHKFVSYINKIAKEKKFFV